MSAGTTGYKRLRKPEETRMRIRKHDSDEPSYPMTALLVDSVDANRHLEHQILESIGIQTEPANNAHEAMQLLLSGVNFDVIFVDFDLPMISGPQFVMDMRVLGIQSKIIGMLSNFNGHNSQMFFEAGVNGNTQKPLTRETFEHIFQIIRIM
ncbi:two-component response regulator 24-like [Vicia villosa]|uniref:two-component response regulator 24-like n=1 Tax=Vicia villosa TaxID=3911 RepID=UPI00273AF576|nr:two-component response regulator 24-like [Vicia villosa]